MSKRFFVAALCAIAIAQPACALVINVTPDGNPQTTLAEINQNPDATTSLAHALAMLKAPVLRDNTGAPLEAITVRLGAGTYRLSETLKLDAGSSGSAEHPVIIQGAGDGSAIISGGRAVHDFKPVTDPAVLARLPQAARTHVLQANLPEQGITDYGKQLRHGWGALNKPTALELIYRNRPMTLARWPNTGFAKIAAIPDGEKGLTFTLQGANLAVWQDEPALLATGYWLQDWADATIPIRAIDQASQKIILTEPSPPYGIKAGQRVFIQNALAELDQPGEWYLNTANGMLYFWPPERLKAESVVGVSVAGEAFFDQNQVEVSLLEKLLIIDNASHIQINNLTFQSARGDAITVKGGHHIALAHSTIRNIGNRGALIGGRDNGLSDMLIENIGEGAVELNGGDRQTLTPANLYLERSTVRRFLRVSRTYSPGVLLTGVGNRVVGNRISDSPQTAILFFGNDHLIALNEIFDVCKETGDAGAIYNGRDWTTRGTVISQNYLHDILPNVDWGRTKGVYLDDQASGTIVRGNLFEKIDQAVFIGGGRDNLIEDNFFLGGEFPIHLDARGKNWKRVVAEEKKDTLQKRLESVPYNRSPYRERYPNLANLLEDEPGLPKYNLARRNFIMGNGKFQIGKDAAAGIVFEDTKIIQPQ